MTNQVHPLTPSNNLDEPTQTTRHYIAVLASIVLLFEIAPLEFSMIYPSLRYMSAEFPTPHIGWVLTTVSLTGIIAMPIIGKLGDIYGKKRMLMCVAGLFALGSLICATAPNFQLLLIGRVLQATSIGITPIAYGLIRDTFPKRMVPIALAAVSTGIGLNGIIGPILGGYLATEFGYRAIFWFLLGYVVILAPIVYLLASESPLRLRHRLDWIGAILLGGGAALLLLGISQGPQWGWGSVRVFGALAASLVLTSIFVAHQLRTEQPLVDIRLLAMPVMRDSMLAGLFASFVIGGFAFALPLMLMTPREVGISYGFGLTALAYALWTTTHGLAGMVGGPLAGLLARRSGPRSSLIIAMASLAISVTLLAFYHDHLWQIAVLAGLYGLGMGFFYASQANLVVESVPASQTGASAGMVGCVNSLGPALGVTVLGAVLAANTLPTEPAVRQIVYSEAGFTYALLAAAVSAVLGLVVAMRMKDGRSPATGGAAAPRLPARGLAGAKADQS
ncbi:MFS transporter [Tomitella biformata]|uniref:MFS transporter n=1 Tax=Tomitella biformata TaxID=630403 RepID=UPI000466C6C7|nr:MFS transporter [Tomitella biformata]